MSRYVVIDLDGCIADDRHRRALIDHDEPDLDKRYAAYHHGCIHDEPLHDNLRLLQFLTKNAEPLIVTSRSEVARTETLIWLERHAPFNVSRQHVLMRPIDDHTPSAILKLRMIRRFAETRRTEIVLCVDDRQDVLQAYRHIGLKAIWLGIDQERKDDPEPPQAIETHEILRNMADTFAERSAQYGDNLLMVQPIMEILFPDGVPQFCTKMHLFELLIMKLTRFATSNLTHTDSIHDLGVYAAMLESHIRKESHGN